MHGQTCMASAADNGIDQDFDQDRDPAPVAGRPGRATAPAVPERLGETDRFAPDGDLHPRAVAPSPLGEDRQRFPFCGGALGRLLPQLLSDPLDGDHILQRDVVVRH